VADEEDVAGGDDRALVDVGSLPPGSAVQAAATTTSTAAVARAREELWRRVGGPGIISTKLPGRAGWRPDGTSSRRKCDKTALFGLTVRSPPSYVGAALIGVNRGRGAGKGR